MKDVSIGTSVLYVLYQELASGSQTTSDISGFDSWVGDTPQSCPPFTTPDVHTSSLTIRVYDQRIHCHGMSRWREGKTSGADGLGCGRRDALGTRLRATPNLMGVVRATSWLTIFVRIVPESDEYFGTFIRPYKPFTRTGRLKHFHHRASGYSSSLLQVTPA